MQRRILPWENSMRDIRHNRLPGLTLLTVLAALGAGMRGASGQLVGDEKRLERLAKWGFETSSSWSATGGYGGSLSVDCNPDPLPTNAQEAAVPGKCVVITNGEKQYTFVYEPKEWVDFGFGGLDEIKKFRTFASAVENEYKPPESKPWVRSDGLLAKGEKCSSGRLCWSMWNGDGYDNNDIGPVDPVCWSLESTFGLNYSPCSPNDDRHSSPEMPWTLDVSLYGFLDQISPGWTEKECKDLMPKYLTGHSFGMMGQDNEVLNRGNLKQVHCFEAGTESSSGIPLAARGLPVSAQKQPEPKACGSVIGPGETCAIR